MFPIIWNFGPDLVKIGSFTVLYYSLFFASSFVLGRKLITFMFKQESQKIELVDKLLVYMMLSTTFGARIGHVVFYEWSYYSKNLLEILLPLSFSSSGVKFTGFRGLASHGATIGILLGVFLFVLNNRKIFTRTSFKKSFGSDFLYIADRVCICVALAGFMIRVGNFMNSEIVGTPVDSNYGVVFVRSFANDIKSHGIVEKVSFELDTKERQAYYQPIKMIIKFDERLRDKEIVKNFIDNELYNIYLSNRESKEGLILFFDENTLPLEIKRSEKNYVAEISVLGIVKHPAQLYESFGCIVLFMILLAIWNVKRKNLRPGSLISFFLIYIFGMRLLYESIKHGTIVYSNEYFSLNTAQALSLPAISIGILIFLYSVLFVRRQKLL